MGAARRRSRGHGPARLDGTRPRATVASKVMDSGKMAGQATARSSRRPHASESAQRRRREGRSGAAGSVVSKGRQAQRGGDGLHSRSPEGKRSAQDRIKEPGRRRQPSTARERWRPEGARRHGWLDAQARQRGRPCLLAGDAQTPRPTPTGWGHNPMRATCSAPGHNRTCNGNSRTTGRRTDGPGP